MAEDKNKLRVAISLALPLCGQAIPTSGTLPRLLALAEVLLQAGWQPPGMTAAAGRASAARRHGIAAIRRILVAGILQTLPVRYRRAPTSLATIDRVHQELQRWGNSEHAGSSIVLKSCRTVADSTVADDLRQISRPSNAFNGKTQRKHAR
jgi:hypothetical protein